MKKSTSRIIVISALIAVILMFAFFLKDILIPYIRLELAHDLDGAKELLISKGVLGLLTVVLVEGLEMVVVFISAEFIQIASGMSYPFYIAIVLCDLGVCLGASIIYVLVKAFKFTSDAYERNEEKIARIAQKSKKDRSTVLLMYLLFIMPLIPFGAICYYGSRTKLKYGKYILTVATGVIPSIVTSILMGTAAKYFIGNDLPLPLLILIIVGLAAVLFLILFIFLDRVYFKENDNTPDSVLYSFFFRVAELLRKRRQRLILDDSALKDLTPPYIILANHSSFYDFYYVKKLLGARNPAYVINRHFMSAPILRDLGHKASFIPKRLFNVDFTTPMSIMRMIRKGYSVMIFPEGRLSITGRNYPITERTGSFYKKIGVDVAIVKIKGAFFANPKWRRRFYKSDITLGVERVITKDELAAMTAEEVDKAIISAISYDDSMDSEPVWKQRDKAEGLENVLYRCIDCGALYTTKGTGNDFVCTACGKVHHIDENYRFTDEPYTIGAYYDRMTEIEKKELDDPDFRLETDVTAVIYSEKGRFKRKRPGACVLTKEGLTFTSEEETFTIDGSLLPALPFSCNKEFEAYHDDKLYYFYPVETRRQVARWALFADVMEGMRNETEG